MARTAAVAVYTGGNQFKVEFAVRATDLAVFLRHQIGPDASNRFSAWKPRPDLCEGLKALPLTARFSATTLTRASSNKAASVRLPA